MLNKVVQDAINEQIKSELYSAYLYLSMAAYSQDPALVDNSGFEITPIERLHTTGSPVDIDIHEYRLVVDGLVENPLRLSYEDILARPSVTEVVLLICPGFFADNAQWTGAPVAGILEEAGVRPEAKEVVFHAADGYRSPLSLEEAMDEGIFLAYRVNGQVLPSEHGYPLRLKEPLHLQVFVTPT